MKRRRNKFSKVFVQNHPMKNHTKFLLGNRPYKALKKTFWKNCYFSFKKFIGRATEKEESNLRELHKPKLYKEATSGHLPRRISKTTTGEKSLSHCHSNRCGHVGQRLSQVHSNGKTVKKASETIEIDIVAHTRSIWLLQVIGTSLWLMQRHWIPI